MEDMGSRFAGALAGDSRLPGQVIELRTKLIPRILFGANKDFALQLNRLDYILGKVKAVAIRRLNGSIFLYAVSLPCNFLASK